MAPRPEVAIVTLCRENNALPLCKQNGTAFALWWLTEGLEGESQENAMSYYRYDDRDLDWETRFRRACRGRSGFAWGAFLIGFILGGIIF